MEDKCQYSHSSWVRRNPCKALWDDYCQTRGLCSNIVTGCEAPVYEMSKLVNITSIISRGYDARKERTSIHGVYKPTCIIGGAPDCMEHVLFIDDLPSKNDDFSYF